MSVISVSCLSHEILVKDITGMILDFLIYVTINFPFGLYSNGFSSRQSTCINKILELTDLNYLLRYFVVANAIACTYATLSLLLALANRSGRKKTLSMLIVIFDLVIVALLFSSIGASLSIGLMGYNGNSHVQWRKVCGVFGKFCHQVAVAVGLSGVASLLFFLLVVLGIFNHHKKH